MNFDLRLQGYVGAEDFSLRDVQAALDARKGKPVRVLIDSLGGSLATSLSISAAFRLHGNVTVHFTGLNASAATIAALGAKRVTMDAGAMYLAHKCSTLFFEWASLNADEFAELIADCENTKEDLDKLDQNVAQLYAARCGKSSEEMLALMKRGGWLTAAEAKEWGFVDEITSLPGDKPARLTDAVASAMAAAGVPLPDVPIEDSQRGVMKNLLAALSGYFKKEDNQPKEYMDKKFTCLCPVLGCEAIVLTDSAASMQEEQLDVIEAALSGKDARIAELEASLKQKEGKISELQAKLDEQPAAETKPVVEAGKKKKEEEPEADEVAEFCAAGASAAALFNSLP